MPIASCRDMSGGWAAALALAAGACTAPAYDAGAVTPPIVPPTRAGQPDVTPGAGARYDLLAVDRGAAVVVTLDAATVAKDGPRDVKVLARHGALIALSDSYPSKPRGAGLCQAGSETWFRVIDMTARKERYARLVDSCTTDALWGDPPVTVAQGGAQLTLNLLSAPAVTLLLRENGQVETSR